MSQKFKSQIDAEQGIKISNELYDGSAAAGSSGQVLSSTGTGTQWIDSSSDKAERIEVTVKNVSGGSLAKGVVVHAAPTATPPSGNVIEVIAADYDTASAMPAIGVLNETIADEAEGAAVMMGAVSGFDTSSFSIGDELYVGNAGGFTATKPATAGQLIQKIAVVIKSHASNGLIKIFGAGRSNDVPLPLYIDNTNQGVGIGTTNIGAQSNLYLGAASSSEGGQITLQKATGGTLAAHIDAYTSGSIDYMRVLSGTDTATTGAPFVFDLTNTSLGIGTTSPSNYNSYADNLVVADSAHSGISIASGTTSLGTLMFADGTGGTAGYRGRVQYDHNTDSMNFHTAAAERLTIDSSGNSTFSGNLGVGGKTPAYGLNLAQGTGSGNKIAWTDGTPDFAASIYASSSTDKLTFATKNSSNVETTALEIDTSQNSTFSGKILVGTGATAAASLNAYTQTVSTGLYSALRIIENSGASSYWDIGATGGGSPDLNFYVNGGTTPKLTIDSSGNVDIGGDLIFGRAATRKILFNSDTNFGSDNAFLYFNENSSFHRTGTENVRFSIGTFNDFANSATHSDALDLQGGSRLFLNAGNWDAELDTAIGDPATGAFLDAYPMQFAVNNDMKVRMGVGGDFNIKGFTQSNFLNIGTYTGDKINSSTLPDTPSEHLINLAPPSDTNYYGGGISWSESANTAASIGVYDAGATGALGFYIATGNNSTLTQALTINDSQEILLTDTHSKSKIKLIGNGNEWIGTSVARLELSGASISLNGAAGSGATNLLNNGITHIDTNHNVYANQYFNKNATTQLAIYGYGNTNKVIDGVSGATYYRASGTSTLCSTHQSGYIILATGLAYGAVNNHTQIINGSTGAISGTSATFSGSVGIGGNTPSSLLMVGDAGTAPNGIATISLTGPNTVPQIASKPGMYHRHSVGLGLFSDYEISFEVNGATSLSEAMRIDADGNVGINEADPSAKLQIACAVDGVGLGVFTSGESTTPNVRFGRDDAQYIGFSVEDRTNNVVFRQDEGTGNHAAHLDLWSSTTDNKTFRFRECDQSGNVIANRVIIENGDFGIGGEPSTKFHVNAFNLPYDNAEGLAIFEDNGDRRIVVGGLGLFRYDTNATADLRMNWIGYNGGITQPRDLDIYDGKKNLIARFDGSTQRVGIGVTAPAQKLQVDGGATGLNQGVPATSSTTQNGILRLTAGTATYGESFDFGMNVSSSPYAWIQATNRGNLAVNYNLALNPNGGNVGISENAPFAKLHIKSSDTGVTAPSAQGNLLVLEDSENGLSILSSTAGAGYINFGDSDDNDVGMIIYGHSSNSMDFWTNAGKRMTVNSIGNLGIGESDPDELLHLKVSTGDPRIKLETGGGGDPGIIFQSANNRTGEMYFQDGSTSGRFSYNHLNESFNLYAHNQTNIDFHVSETSAYFTQQNVGIASEKSIYFASLSDPNWRIGRNIHTYGTSIVSGSSLDFMAHAGGNQGVTFGPNITNGLTSLEIKHNDNNVHQMYFRGNVGINETGILANRKLYTGGGYHLGGGGANSGGYTADGLFGATATPNTLTFSSGRRVLLGYTDNGSGLYAETMAIETHSTDGLNNTVERNALLIKNVNSGSWVFQVTNLGMITCDSKIRIATSRTDEALNVNGSIKGVSSQGYTTFFHNDPYHGICLRGTPNAYNSTTMTPADVMSFMEYSGDFRFYQKKSNGVLSVQGKLLTGTWTVSGDVIAYGSPSDISLKENIKPIESALDKAMKLQGVTFDWKEKEDNILDIKEDIGFIAQDVQKVVPELVRQNNDGLLSLRHQGIAPILLEAIKELKAEVDVLRNEIKELKK